MSWDIEETKSAIAAATTKADVFIIMGKSKSGAAYRYFDKFIKANNIDISHFTNKRNKSTATTLEEYLVLNGPTVTSYRLKYKLWNA
jgi:hypothetical protein